MGRYGKGKYETLHKATGYIYSYKPNHGKRSSDSQLKHRVIYENFLGRKLAKNEILHHKNGDKTDNRIENLELMTRNKHNNLHHNWEGKNNPTCNITPKHKESFKRAWVIRKKKFGETGAKNPKQLREKGIKNNEKRWRRD